MLHVTVISFSKFINSNLKQSKIIQTEFNQADMNCLDSLEKMRDSLELG